MIIEPFYSGWNIAYQIHGAVKRSVISLGRSGEAREVNKLADNVCQDLSETGYDIEENRLQLASHMATRILETLTEEELDFETLPFHEHLKKFCFRLIEYENLFSLPEQLFDKNSLEKKGMFSSPEMPRSILWEIDERLKKLNHTLNNFDEIMGRLATMAHHFIEPMVVSNPSLLQPKNAKSEDGSNPLTFSTPLSMTINNLNELVETMVQLPHAPEFDKSKTTSYLRERIEYNVVLASGGGPGDTISNTRLCMPTKSKITSPTQLIKDYLNSTPMLDLFDYEVPIQIPQEVRFEHQHIVAGTGHGKTQTLQHHILNDLEDVVNGNASMVVIDSQGDLINKISGLSIFAPTSPLADKLVIIDPTDMEYPISLNLFDVGMERLNRYSKFEKERVINGVVELYNFVIGTLLQAELTQKQELIFQFLIRLMIEIPNSTIHTLYDLLQENGAQQYQADIKRLNAISRKFFETEFDSKEYADTKKQVTRRLWGILQNETFTRMFSHPKNKFDLYSDMNAGKVILINTSKELFKDSGTEMLGRFFIAMISQAAQERAAIEEDDRMPTFIYIDEANDYFDDNFAIILSQARKYKVGMILAHQYLGQLKGGLKQAFATNTSIKFAGGVSSGDANALASEMRTDSAFIETQEVLSFAAHIKGHTKQAMTLSIKPGQMEALDRMSHNEYSVMIARMREKYAVHYTELETPEIEEPPLPDEDEIDVDNFSDEPADWHKDK